jgi:hypothetical protein
LTSFVRRCTTPHHGHFAERFTAFEVVQEREPIGAVRTWMSLHIARCRAAASLVPEARFYVHRRCELLQLKYKFHPFGGQSWPNSPSCAARRSHIQRLYE